MVYCSLHGRIKFILVQYLSESGPFLAMRSLSLEKPPTGILSLPVVNINNCFFCSKEKLCTIYQNHLQAEQIPPLNNNWTPWLDNKSIKDRFKRSNLSAPYVSSPKRKIYAPEIIRSIVPPKGNAEMKGTRKICYSTVYVFFRANVISPRNWSILWLYPSKREVCLTDSQLQLKTKVERQGPILFSALVRCPCYTVWTKRSKESDGLNIQSWTFLGFWVAS